MKVIILCGGVGTRLKEETEFKPKPMVLVGNKPILWHIMRSYAAHGFNEFILALGYKANYIKEFFLYQKAYTTDFALNTKNFSTKYFLKNREESDDFSITFVDTGVETLPGERILKCRKYIPETDKYFMVTYGDGVSDIDLKKVYKFHVAQGKIGTITAVHPRTKYGLVKITKTNLATKFVEKPVLEDWVNGGFMVFSQKIFDYLKPGQTEHPALQKLASQRQLSVYRHNKFWFAVDTYKELEELNNIWKSGKAPWKV